MKTKQDVVDKISASTSIPKVEVKKVIESFVEVVDGELAAGNQIQIRSFGTFKKVRRAAKTARNMKTGAKVDIPARDKKVFVFSDPY